LSSLITTAANILKGWSTIPFIGQALGIAAIVTMFSAFAAAKAKAFAATKFKQGGAGRVDGNSIIVGASHDSGGVGIEAEGGEFFATDGERFGIVNKKMTAKHFDLITAINKDDRRGMASALESLTRPSINVGAVSRSAGIQSGGDTHNLLKEWRQESRNKPTRTVEGQYIVERKGNRTKKTRIR